MPSFNENPTEFADLNTAFPELSSQVGLSYQQVQAIGENEYYNKNQITQANSQLNSIKDGASIDSFGDVESALANKQDTIQYSTMPTASADNVGAIVQYTGDTDSTYTNGYFYKCVESGGTYSWEEVISGGGGGGGDVPANMVTTDTVQTITSEKWLNGGWKIGTFPSDPSIRTFNWGGMTNDQNGGSIEMRRFHSGVNTRDGIRYSWAGLTYFNNFGVALGGIERANDTLNDGAFAVVKKTHSSTPYQAFNFNQVIIAFAGDTITIKMTAQEVFNGEIIYCLSNSTDNPISYKAGHIYRVNDVYDSSTQTYNITTVDITPFKKDVYTNVSASTWVSDNTYADYAYKCELNVSGVTANDYAEVVFGVAEATSGDYAPIAETGAGTITIYSKVNTSITIPTIKVEKL